MNIRDAIPILGITVGIIAIIIGVGLGASGILENRASDASTERVCEEYPDMPDPGETKDMSCKEYNTYQVGEESPGTSDIAYGIAICLVGGAIVYRVTQ